MNLNDNEKAKRIDELWAYAKSSDHPKYSPSFERWFKNRAILMYKHTQQEANCLWSLALRMHS